MGALPLALRRGTLSQAGRWLHQLLATPSQHDAPSPFFHPARPVRLHRDAQNAQSYASAQHRVHVFHDNSALLSNRACTVFLPRALRLDTRLPCGPGLPPWSANGTQALRDAVMAHLWDTHAQGPVLARPIHSTTSRPEPGTFWSPHDTFPTHTATTSPLPNDERYRRLDPMINQILTGMVLDILPSVRLTPDDSGRLWIAFFHPESPLTCTVGSLTISIPARGRTTICGAIPELEQAIGPGFWHTATPEPSLRLNNACLMFHPLDTAIAHQRLAATAAWRQRLTPAQHDTWNDVLVRFFRKGWG